MVFPQTVARKTIPPFGRYRLSGFSVVGGWSGMGHKTKGIFEGGVESGVMV